MIVVQQPKHNEIKGIQVNNNNNNRNKRDNNSNNKKKCMLINDINNYDQRQEKQHQTKTKNNIFSGVTELSVLVKP